jgi:hypothetical protein
MSEESWHQARLIPTSGINGSEEQERRATSALLAVMSAVREFGRALTRPLGAPAATLETYIEVPFTWAEKKCFPDGLIRVRRGQRSWTALVEVKTGNNELDATQLETYLDVAKEQGFDAVVTVSNEIPAVAGTHPAKIDKRKLRKVALHHYSWSQVLSEAVMQKEHRGVADPDQAWILGELIRYLEHPRSGALEFDDMGASWVGVRDAVAASTLRATDKAAPEVAARFDALLRYASLRLGRQLGTEVTPALSRKELAEPALRTQTLVASLATAGTLTGAIRIPNTVGQLEVTADLRAGKVTCHVDVAAPREGRPVTRVNWLVRQLKNAPDTVRVEAFAAHARGASSAELLCKIRENPAVLITDPGKELRAFRVGLDRPLGAKRGRGRGSFIDSILDAVDACYAEVMQYVKVWTAAPPKVRETGETQPVAAALVSTALSSQDGSEDVVEPPGASSVEGVTVDETSHEESEEDAAPPQWAESPPGARGQGTDSDPEWERDQELLDQRVADPWAARG